MRRIRRNDKEHQKIQLQASYEAEETLMEIHGLLARTSRKGSTVGRMFSIAAQAGLLGARAQLR